MTGAPSDAAGPLRSRPGCRNSCRMAVAFSFSRRAALNRRACTLANSGVRRFRMSSVPTGRRCMRPGHLVFVRDSTLFAQRFDPNPLELSGSPQNARRRRDRRPVCREYRCERERCDWVSNRPWRARAAPAGLVRSVGQAPAGNRRRGWVRLEPIAVAGRPPICGATHDRWQRRYLDHRSGAQPAEPIDQSPSRGEFAAVVSRRRAACDRTIGHR